MADVLLVSARVGQGLGVFAVPAGTRGLTVRGYRTVDGGRAADVELVDVAVPASALLGGNEYASAAIEAAIHRAIAALSADAVGAMTALVSATVDYTQTRVQFGQPPAKFHAPQHPMRSEKR